MNSLRRFSTVFALALFAGCARQAPDSGAGPSLPPLKAQVALVHLETVPFLTEITGTVHAVERAQLAAKVMGSIDTMPFTLGQHVKRGDTLATISAGEINARVAQAESQFNQANRDLARERELLPKGASTATMVKDLEDRCAGDEAILREAKVMLSYATLHAPFDGVITQKFANVGDLASPGLPLIAIEGSNGFEVQAGVPDSLAFGLGVGKLLVVQTSTEGVTFSGKISEISSAADANSHTVAVKISRALRCGRSFRPICQNSSSRRTDPGAPGALGIGHDLGPDGASLCRRQRQPRGASVGHDWSPPRQSGRDSLRPRRRGPGDPVPAGRHAGRPTAGDSAVKATPMSPFNEPARYGFAGRMASLFIDSKLTPILIAASLLLGVFAVLLLPREEEPQIKVPMIDVMVAMPGATAHEIENRVTRPMEMLLWEIPGVEYLYSTASPGADMTIVRFKVGIDPEVALVRLNQKLQANLDRMPLGVVPPLIKSRTIDDVPILALTFHSSRYDHAKLRQLAVQVEDAIKVLPQVAETTVIGGQPRSIRVLLDPQRLASRNLSPAVLVPMLQQANAQAQTGSQAFGNRETLLQTGDFFRNAKDVGAVVVGVFDGNPIYLREVAQISDQPADPSDYVLFGYGGSLPKEEAAVTLSIAKRPGANAVDVVKEVVARVDGLRGNLIPADIGVSVTRDYGATARDKSNELLLHMGLAVFGVAILILLFLGWRESLVVLLAIPVTLGLTLLVFYLYGYTLNRITLFALIFSIGILVDDAIVVVENIVRHMGLPSCRRKRLAPDRDRGGR